MGRNRTWRDTPLPQKEEMLSVRKRQENIDSPTAFFLLPTENALVKI
jgi:hypothetical protein